MSFPLVGCAYFILIIDTTIIQDIRPTKTENDTDTYEVISKPEVAVKSFTITFYPTNETRVIYSIIVEGCVKPTTGKQNHNLLFETSIHINRLSQMMSPYI